jgi:hypothetical protein
MKWPSLGLPVDISTGHAKGHAAYTSVLCQNDCLTDYTVIIPVQE